MANIISYTFSFFNSSLDLAGLKHYQKIIIHIFRHALQNFAIPGSFPVKQHIEFKISVLVYKCLNGVAPQYLCKLLHFYAKDRDLRSADDKTLLETPQVRTKFGKRTFCYYAPKIWNSLPKNVRSSKSIDTFKKKVKSHLFSLAYHGKWLLKWVTQ